MTHRGGVTKRPAYTLRLLADDDDIVVGVMLKYRLKKYADALRWIIRRFAAKEETVKLSEMDELALLDCTHAARELFNALPRLSAADQDTLIDYIEMRLEMRRKQIAVVKQ